MELKPPEHAARFGRWESGVESGSGVGGEVIEDDADALGLWEVDIDELAHADGEVVSGATTSDLDPAPRAMGVKEDKEIDGAVAAILVIEAFGPSRRGWDRLARFADELGGAFVEADHGPLRVKLLGIEVEHILHAGDVLGVDLGDAPHVLLPGLEMVLSQASADGLARQTVMVGQLDHRASQQLQRPAGATFGRARTGGGDEEGFFVAGQLTIGACPRLLVQGGFEIAFNEAAFGPVNGRAADRDSSGNIVIVETAVGGEQNLGSFDLPPARRVHTVRLRSVRHGSVCSSGSPRESRRPDESGYESIVWHVSPPAPPFTDKQGQYLAFIYAYGRIFRQPPAEADMQRHFQVSPPSVHQMVLTLERAGLIRRTPGVARSIEILVEPEDLPVLR